MFGYQGHTDVGITGIELDGVGVVGEQGFAKIRIILNLPSEPSAGASRYSPGFKKISCTSVADGLGVIGKISVLVFAETNMGKLHIDIKVAIPKIFLTITNSPMNAQKSCTFIVYHKNPANMREGGIYRALCVLIGIDDMGKLFEYKLREN